MSAIDPRLSANVCLRVAAARLKTQRKRILMLRVTASPLGHLQSRLAQTETGAIVALPIPGLYQNPQAVLVIVHHSFARSLDVLNAPASADRDWDGKTVRSRVSAALPNQITE